MMLAYSMEVNVDIYVKHEIGSYTFTKTKFLYLAHDGVEVSFKFKEFNDMIKQGIIKASGLYGWNWNGVYWRNAVVMRPARRKRG